MNLTNIDTVEQMNAKKQVFIKNKKKISSTTIFTGNMFLEHQAYYNDFCRIS